jgi:hypothetical protein
MLFIGGENSTVGGVHTPNPRYFGLLLLSSLADLPDSAPWWLRFIAAKTPNDFISSLFVCSIDIDLIRHSPSSSPSAALPFLAADTRPEPACLRRPSSHPKPNQLQPPVTGRFTSLETTSPYARFHSCHPSSIAVATEQPSP